MQVHPSELADLGYEVDVQLNHKELIPFVKNSLKLKTKSAWFYRCCNFLLFGMLVFIGTAFALSDALSFDDFFSHLGFGAAISFGLIPFHEYLHVLAYKFVGAKNTSYAANLKKFYFMALANQFVANRNEFRIIALTPFVVISAFCLLLMPFVGGLWQITLLGILTLHTAFCSGDFGLLAYMEFHKESNPLTFDDVSESLSYFMLQKNPADS